MRPSRRPLVASLAALLLAPSATAAATRCDVEPFGFSMPAQTEESNRPTGLIGIEWWMIGRTSLHCGAETLAIDVWEHAYGVFGCDDGTGSSVPFQGGVRVGLLTADGKVVNFAGRIQGAVTCDAAGMATVEASLRASGRDGSRLRLRQTTLIDTSTGEIVWADEVRGSVHLAGTP